MKASVGRIVHYVVQNNGKPKAAIITDVVGDLVWLSVFNPVAGPMVVGNVPHEKNAVDRMPFWRWPPRVE